MKHYLKQYNNLTAIRFPKWRCNYQFFVETNEGDVEITTILYGIVK